MAQLKYTSNELKIKDVDETQGIVTAYYSNYGSIDSDREIIEPGSATKTAQERGPNGSNRIKHLKNHNLTQAPGKIIELGEDEKGGWFRSQLAKHNGQFSTLANDTLIEYHSGVITEHSHGFETIKSDRDEAGINHIKEIRLWEASTLTAWGANPNTPVRDLKDLSDPYKILIALENVQKYLNVGEFSDELLEIMEKKFKNLNEIYNSLANNEPQRTHEKNKPDLSILINQLKIEL